MTRKESSMQTQVFNYINNEWLASQAQESLAVSNPATLEVLTNAVILIDPMLNPDGRDAFADLNHQNIGRLPNPMREDWSNDFDRWQPVKFRTFDPSILICSSL